MPNNLNSIFLDSENKKKSWGITGVAGFIGSNILEVLLKNNQIVFGLDNFSTGFFANLEDVKSKVTSQQWNNFTFFKGDIRNIDDCMKLCKNSEVVLHQAALGSVPRSIADPILTNDSNINGFLNILMAVKDCGVERFVYAASSSTYGDSDVLPKSEKVIGNPLSPYAVTKYVNELYAHVFFLNYGVISVGLRYFNVFGRRQNPKGAYAAVIPKWIQAYLANENICIYGDGETSRDFCYVDNAVQANILAAISTDIFQNEVFNIAVGERTSLNNLNAMIMSLLESKGIKNSSKVFYEPFRKGDVKHSEADISKAKYQLAYLPSHNIEKGLEDCIDWYIDIFK
tara:strand:- start:13188 stop:14213 length:1026 start_codon:yes stop_codon:yes gene_type:complete